MTRNLCFMAEFGNYFEPNYPCCVVPENIHTSPTEGNGNSDGRGSETRKFPKGRGVASRGFFPGGPSKIGELLINNNFSVVLATSYLTLNRCQPRSKGSQNNYYCLHYQEPIKWSLHLH